MAVEAKKAAWSLSDVLDKKSSGVIFDKELRESTELDKTYTFVLSKQNRRGKKFPPSYTVANDVEAMVYDPELNDYVPKRIRYFKGCSTIFFDEQTELEQAREKMSPIVFHQGVKVVDRSDRNLLQFMLLTPENGDNAGTRNPDYNTSFTRFDGDKINRDANKKESEITEAKYKILKAAPKEIEALAFALLTKKGYSLAHLREAGIEALRNELSKYAADNPAPFLNMKNDTSMFYSYHINNSIVNGVLTLSEVNNTIYWADTKEVFISGPNGMRVVDYAAELATKDTEVEALVKKAAKLTAPNSEMDEKYDKVKVGKPVDFMTNLIETLIEKGHLSINEAGNHIKEINFDTDEPRSWKGKRKLKEAMQEDKELFFEFSQLAMVD